MIKTGKILNLQIGKHRIPKKITPPFQMVDVLDDSRLLHDMVSESEQGDFSGLD